MGIESNMKFRYLQSEIWKSKQRNAFDAFQNVNRKNWECKVFPF